MPGHDVASCFSGLKAEVDFCLFFFFYIRFTSAIDIPVTMTLNLCFFLTNSGPFVTTGEFVMLCKH